MLFPSGRNRLVNILLMVYGALASALPTRPHFPESRLSCCISGELFLQFLIRKLQTEAANNHRRGPSTSRKGVPVRDRCSRRYATRMTGFVGKEIKPKQ